MSLIEHANQTIKNLKEENSQLISGIYATKLVKDLESEIGRLRLLYGECQKISAEISGRNVTLHLENLELKREINHNLKQEMDKKPL